MPFSWNVFQPIVKKIWTNLKIRCSIRNCSTWNTKEVRLEFCSFPTWMFSQYFVDLSLCPPPIGRIQRSRLLFFAAVVVVARLPSRRRVLSVVVVVVSDFRFRFWVVGARILNEVDWKNLLEDHFFNKNRNIYHFRIVLFRNFNLVTNSLISSTICNHNMIKSLDVYFI